MTRTQINKRATKVLAGLHGNLYNLSGGRIGATLRGADIIVLGTTGRKSGTRRERPLIGGDHPAGWVVIASYSGHDEHPAWYLNLRANPEATVRVGREVHDVKARETEGDEKAQLWARMVELYADYADYRAVTDRDIPVLVLERT